MKFIGNFEKIQKLSVSVSVCRIFQIAGTETLANKKAEPRGNHERIHVCGGFCRDKSEPVSLPW